MALIYAAAALVMAPGLSLADPPSPLSRSELVDAWGSILYCQAIYEEPAVRARVYRGDRNHCDSAQAVLAGMAENIGNAAQSERIAREAARKAAAIRYNTPSLDDAVTACRQQCRNFKR